jgi:nitroreductase
MRIFKKLLPGKLKKSIRGRYNRSRIYFFIESFLDARKYMRAADFSAVTGQTLAEHLEADIVRLYHQIEKGLAMRDFRPRFGVKLLSALIPRLEEWNRRFPCSDDAVQNRQVKGAYEALKEYTKRHEALGIDVEDLVPREMIRSTTSGEGNLAGVKQLRKVSESDRDAFRRVVETRVSVRDFQVNRIPEHNKVERAIEAAIWSPSVCNRQTWRVHVYEGERAQEVLSLQNGNRGFGHNIPMVLIVTSDMRYFTGTPERYQAWIDGGLFSMTLLLALHAEGLGAVSLNWCVNNQRDNRLRRAGGIPDGERIMMLIGCGYSSENAMVPLSMRRPVEEIIRWDKS